MTVTRVNSWQLNQLMFLRFLIIHLAESFASKFRQASDRSLVVTT